MELQEAKNKASAVPSQRVLHFADVTPADEIPDENMLLYYQFKNGEKFAITTLVQRLHQRAFSLAYGIVKNSHDAEDVVQQSWINIMQRDSNLNYLGKFDGYFLMTVANQCRDFIRRNKRRRLEHNTTDEPNDYYALSEGETADTVDVFIEEDFVQYILSTLGEKYRELLTNLFFRGSSMQEVAIAEQRNPSTIRHRYMVAKQKFLANYNAMNEC